MQMAIFPVNNCKQWEEMYMDQLSRLVQADE